MSQARFSVLSLCLLATLLSACLGREVDDDPQPGMFDGEDMTMPADMESAKDMMRVRDIGMAPNPDMTQSAKCLDDEVEIIPPVGSSKCYKRCRGDLENTCKNGGQCFMHPSMSEDLRAECLCPRGFTGLFNGGPGNFCECEAGQSKMPGEDMCKPIMCGRACESGKICIRTLNGQTMCAPSM